MASKTINPATATQAAWSVDADWTPAGTPGTPDDVALAAGSSVSVTAPSLAGTLAVAAGALLDITPTGSLSVGNGLTLNGTLQLDGTLSNTVLRLASGSLLAGTGTLSADTINGTDTLAPATALNLQTSLTLTATNAPGLVATGAGDTVTTTPSAGASPGAVTSQTTINGGLIVLGSAAGAAPVQFSSGTASTYFAPGTFIDIVGQTVFGPQYVGGTLSQFVNAGTLLVGPGGKLVLNAALYGGSIHIQSGTLDASASNIGVNLDTITMDDANANLVLGTFGYLAVKGFRAGDTIDVRGATLSAANIKAAATGETLTYGGLTIMLPDAPANATYAFAPDGQGGTVVTTAAPGPATPPSYAIAPLFGAHGVPAANTFIVTRSGDTSTAAVLHFAVAGAGANPATVADFTGGTLPAGTVTFNGGDTVKIITLPGAANAPAGQAYTVTLSGDPGTAVTTATANGYTPVPPYGTYAFTDTTAGVAGVGAFDAPGAGSPSYLEGQYIYAGTDNLAVATNQPNVFIHGGTGDDAIQVGSGQNVLDGGLGSNFLVGGSGSDTFFTDARTPGAVWNTVVNFHAGDAVTLWGFTAGVSSYYWDGISGAPGSQGATLRANIVGGAGRTGNGIDASITFAGLTVAQAQALQVSTGTQPAGNYLYLHAV